MFDSVLSSAVVRWGQVRQSQVWSPPTDVYETDASIVVKIEIAGLSPEDFSISLAHRVLAIRGVRQDPASKLVYQRMEINYGQFQTEVYLPWPVNERSEIEATYEQGFLTILLPKAPARRVPVTDDDHAA
jgi:HSP20 family protein